MLKDQQSMQGALVVPLLAGLIAACMTGVLISPPDAVHEQNHDYHAVFQKRPENPTFAHGQAALVVHSAATWCALACNSLLDTERGPLNAGRRNPVLSIVQTLRLLL